MGVVGLETAFAVMYTHFVKTGRITLEKLVELMSVNPARRFGIGSFLEEGQSADLAVFDLSREWVVNPEEFSYHGTSHAFCRMFSLRPLCTYACRRRDGLERKGVTIESPGVFPLPTGTGNFSLQTENLMCGASMKQGIYTIIEHKALTKDVYRMVLSGDTSAMSMPGQFIEISLPGFFLRRPISVCDYDADTITIIYKVVGQGTDAMARMKTGRYH